LTSLGALVGEERAVESARRVLGPAALAAALPLLQPAALTRETRSGIGGRRDRRDVPERPRPQGAAPAGGAPPPRPHAAPPEPPTVQQLYRVDGRSVLMAVGTLIAIGALLSQLGSPEDLWDTMQGAQWSWILLAFALSMSTNLAYAVGLMGCVPIRLPLGPTT